MHHPISVNKQYVSLQSRFKMIVSAFRFEINRLFVVLHDVASGRDGKKKIAYGHVAHNEIVYAMNDEFY
jgi:hypothetical protein